MGGSSNVITVKNALKTDEATTLASFYKDPIISFAVYGITVPYTVFLRYVRTVFFTERAFRTVYVRYFFELPYTVFCSERYGTHALITGCAPFDQ